MPSRVDVERLIELEVRAKEAYDLYEQYTRQASDLADAFTKGAYVGTVNGKQMVVVLDYDEYSIDRLTRTVYEAGAGSA